MGEQKPEKTKKHICAGLLAHVTTGKTNTARTANLSSFVSTPAETATACRMNMYSMTMVSPGEALKNARRSMI